MNRNTPATRFVIVLLAGLAAAGNQTASAQSSACDRECLRGAMTAFLYALVENEPDALPPVGTLDALPLAATLRVTEDAIEKPLAELSLFHSVTGLHGYRQDIIDERAGMSGAHVIVEESGAPVMLVVRLKLEAGRITEIETVATRNSADGLIFNIDGLRAPSKVMNYAPRPEQLSSREDAIEAAMHYPRGLDAAQTFAAVDAPFAPDAYRLENGQIMAGPDCTFAAGCQNISTQSLAIFERLGNVSTRVIGVDERMGIVWLRMAWGVREEGGDQLTVWEAFKVYDGQIHAVEAFMKILPVELRSGGWE
jgi:hypothetical protein